MSVNLAPDLAPEPDIVPDATIRKRRAISMVWLVPIIAAALAIWLAVVTVREQGPTIEISFDTADGLEAGKTKVKYKDVEIGAVEEVRLTDDFAGVVAVAKMSKQAESLMVQDTRFWVVRPRVGLSGVSGLGTLLSGAYIEIDPGTGTGTPGSEFVGLKEPPPVTSDVPGRRYILQADTLGSIERGAPVYYNGLRVGQVLSYHLDSDNRSFTIPIFVEAPYDQLVRGDSPFLERQWDRRLFLGRGGEYRTGIPTGLAERRCGI